LVWISIYAKSLKKALATRIPTVEPHHVGGHCCFIASHATSEFYRMRDRIMSARTMPFSSAAASGG
jgi:hypothetical protein